MNTVYLGECSLSNHSLQRANDITHPASFHFNDRAWDIMDIMNNIEVSRSVFITFNNNKILYLCSIVKVNFCTL